MKYFWIALLALLPMELFSASFDCQLDGLDATEQAICADPELSKLDDDLSIDYENKRKQLQPFEADHWFLEAFDDRQKRWLKSRNECGGDADCIRTAYLDWLNVDNLDEADQKINHIKSLDDELYLVDYVYWQDWEDLWEVLYVSRFDNPADYSASGDLWHNNKQELRVLQNGVIVQVLESEDWGFLFETLEMDKKISRLRATEDGLILRGQQVYTFVFRHDFGLELIDLSRIIVTNGGEMESTDFDFDLGVLKRARSNTDIGCEIPLFPEFFELNAETALSDISQYRAFPDLDGFVGDIGLDQEDYSETERMVLFNRAAHEFTENPEYSVEVFEKLAEMSVPNAARAAKCVREFQSVMEEQG